MKRLYNLAQNYMSLGTHIPTEDDVPQFTRLCNDLNMLPNDQTEKDRYIIKLLSSWLHFEFGMVYENENQAQSRGYFAAAKLLMPDNIRWPVISAGGAFISSKNKILLDVYGSRLGEQNDHYELKNLDGIRSLGSLLVDATRECERTNGQAYYDYRGIMAEIAVAGTLLLPAFEDDQNTFFVTPASLRQDHPYTTTPYQDRKVVKRSAIDLNVFDASTNYYTPVQIKTREHPTENNYREDILMLYAERDLFTISNQEYEQLGCDLANFDNTSDPSHSLFLAKSNVDLAYKIHTGLPLNFYSSHS